MGLDKFSPFRRPCSSRKKPWFSPWKSLGASLGLKTARRAATIRAGRFAATALMTAAGMLAALLAARADDGVAIPTRLPQRHAYQRTLYQFMATVTESDTAHGVSLAIDPKAEEPRGADPPAKPAGAAAVPAEPAGDSEMRYREFLYTRMQQPLVGTKRGYPAVNASAACFTLPLIEQPDGVYYAPAWPEALVSFLQWRHRGNPFQGNRGLKMRAFMTAASNMMMFHEMLERTEHSQPPVLRSDQHGYNPVFWAFPYPGFRDVLPEETRQAYETGLRMIGERLIRWQPRGDGGGRDYILPVGLLHIARALGDREFLTRVEQHAKPLYTDPRSFHEAGYWDERGGIDTGFSGTANWFAVWTGLVADWPFVPAALEKVYRLRRHLLLPEPDGSATGPSHFNSRLGSPVNADQWHWDGVRDAGAAMLTDQAVQFALRPTDEQLRQAPADRARAFAFQLSEHGVENGKLISLEALQAGRKMPMKWVPRVWMTYNFPASVNPAYEFYRPGTWARLQSLAADRSPLLHSPYADIPGGTAEEPTRPAETFTREFGRDFVAVRRPGYAAILHTGPVGRHETGDARPAFPGPLGLGGGQLSAFWTPQTGSVLLGLRRGTSNDRSFDVLDEWRTWPAHMVAGRLESGLVFSSARCVAPRASFSAFEARVEGQLMGMETIMVDGAAGQPPKPVFVDRPLARSVGYRRLFSFEPRRVRVETVVSDIPADSAELYEVLPVYLRHEEKQPKAEPTVIEFSFSQAAPEGEEQWTLAGDEPVAGVASVRLSRFGASVTVRFDRPQRVVLSPAAWRDNWLNAGAASRNILVDLLADSARAEGGVSNGHRTTSRVGYGIAPSQPRQASSVRP